MKNKLKKLSLILLSFVCFMFVGTVCFIPTKMQNANANTISSTSVYVNECSFSYTKKYYKNGESDTTSSSAGYNAYYDESTNTLTLNNYNGDCISLGGSIQADLNIVLIGNNVITTNCQKALYSINGGGFRISSSSNATLTINSNTSYSMEYYGISTGTWGNGILDISGQAKVVINLTSTNESPLYGVLTDGAINVKDNAQLEVTLSSNITLYGISAGAGLYAKKAITFNTTNKIKVDTSAVQSINGNFGIYSENSVNLTSAEELKVITKSGTKAGAIYPATSVDSFTGFNKTENVSSGVLTTTFAKKEIKPTNLVWDDYYENRATWTAPEGYSDTYYVTLLGSATSSNPNNMVEIVSFETSETSYDFYGYINDCMNYAFRVQAKQGSGDYAFDNRSNTKNATKTLRDFSYKAWWPENSDYFRWNQVSGAEGYYIFVKKNGGQVGLSDYTENTYYNIYSYIQNYGTGTYSLDVFATSTKNAPNYIAKTTSADNVVDNYIHDLTLSGDILSWTPVESATKYEFFVGIGGGYIYAKDLDYNSETNKYSYNLKNKCMSNSDSTGTKTWEITAYNDSTRISITSKGTYEYTNTKTPLATPTNLKWDGNTISWDAVENAHLYSYSINDGVYSQTSETSVTLSVFKTDIEYRFYVYAIPYSDDFVNTKSETAESSPKTFTATVTLSNSNVTLNNLKNNSNNIVAENCVLNITDSIQNAYYYEVNIGAIGGIKHFLPINLLNICKGTGVTSGTYNIDITVRDKSGFPLTNTYVLSGWNLDATKYTNDLTGTVEITGNARVGETLTAIVTDSNNTGTLYYHWTRYSAETGLIDNVKPYIERNGSVFVSTSNTYTLTEDEVGYKICCFVDSSIEDITLESSKTDTVEGSSLKIVSVGGVALTTGEIVQGSFPVGHIGKSYSATLVADGGSGNYTWSIIWGSLPAGLVLYPSTGVISGTPTATQTGYITVSVTDNDTAKSAVANISLLVASDDWLPKITTSVADNGVKNKEYYMSFECGGNEVNESITWTVLSGVIPTGLSLSKSGQFIGVLSGTPTALGTYTFELKAENVFGYDTKEYTIKIENLMSVTFSSETYYCGDTVQLTSDIGNNTIWSLGSHTSETTTISEDGLLTIGSDENQASYILVYAKSKTNKYNQISVSVYYTQSLPYTITVIDGVAKNSLDNVITKINEGGQVNIEADEKEGKKFREWTVEEGSAEITINNVNEKETYFTMPSGNVVVKANYDTIISSVSASFDAPINGNHVDTTLTTGSENYTAEMTRIWQGAGYCTISEVVYETGKEYVFYVNFTAKTGYVLDSNSTLSVTINGKILKYDSDYYGGWMITLTALAKGEITAVDVVCTGYKVGANIADAIPTTSTEGVTISYYQWLDNTTGEPITTGVFETETIYRIAIYLTANEGYTLESLTHDNAKFNNVKVSHFTNPTYGSDGSLGQVKLYHYPAELAIISFNANGGTGIMESVEKTYNQTYTIPNNEFTAPDGKQFKCWQVGGENKNVGSTITITENITLTAIWEDIPAVTYSVTYQANGGTGDDVVLNDIEGTYVLASNTFTAPEGKEFKCWSVDGTEKQVGETITITKDMIVKAVWENSKYTISFDGNGGSGTISNVEKTYNETFTLPANTFTAPEGKEFKCWSVDGTEKQVGETITITKDTTIKAVWEDIKKDDKEEDEKDIPTTPEQKKGMSAGAVIGIVLLILVVLTAGAYFALGFTLYKKGKLTGKFFETIFKWIKK